MNTSELFACLQERMPAGSLSAGPGEPAAARHELLRQARPPLCIVRPGNAGELDAIVRYANETGLTLAVTSSTGRHRRGGIANATEHVLVDLSGWKKIDLIDRRNRVCRVEPGVTYRELAIALDPHGLTVPMPLAPRDGKSVLAAVMDREPGTWPRVQWDAADPVCSTEFTFGSGERFRTGAAGGPGSIEQQRAAGGAQKHPAGPSQADFHRLVQGSQGTLGIVHWITLRAEIRPARPEAYLIGVEWLDDLIETVYGVQRGLLGEQSFIMNRTAAAWLMCAEDRQFFAEMRRSLPAFVCLQVIAGLDRLPEGRAAYHGQEIVRIAGERGLWLEESIGKLSAGALYDRATWPCGETDWRDDLTGGCMSVFFQSTLDRMPGLLKVFADAAAEFGIPEAEIGAYVQPVVQNHACHIELLVPVAPDDPAQVERLAAFEREVTGLLMAAGAFFSRPYGSAGELVWAQNPGGTRLARIVKGIFDPHEALQRGKWFPPEIPGPPPPTPGTRDLSELVDIVGKQWVSTAPCVLDTYAYYQNPETMNKDGSQWLPRPAAVVLPGSTAEVQAIMRFCSSSRYMAKPLSTGFHAVAAGSSGDAIILDLKRMNRIVELDLKNQVAVIEPYVRAVDLQTEIVKHGLNCHIVSAGANHSLLASHTSAWGFGVSGAATSYSGRNLLGVEWVLPAGEVVTLGSAGCGAGWFSADGPGPSLRGIVRGFQGAFGGLGVFTRCAIKLYKWDGPREWEVTGRSPKYVLKEIPPRCALNAIAFPSANAERDAGYKMGEAELNHAEFRTPMFFAALGLTEANEELKALLETGLFQKVGRHVITTAIFAASDAEFAWKMDALRQILSETGGVLIPLNLPVQPRLLWLAGKLARNAADPLALLRRFRGVEARVERLPLWAERRRERQSALFWLLFCNANNTQAAFRPSQGMATMLGAFDTWDLAQAQAEHAARIKEPYIRQGVILDDGGDLSAGGTFEAGHLGYLEGIILYDPGDPRSARAARELVEAGSRDAIANALGVPIAAFGVEANALFGPACGDYDMWLSRIKAALDPCGASDPFFYAESRPQRPLNSAG